VRGFEVTPEKLAAAVVHAVGPGGNYLAEDHTVAHYRQELWMPDATWTREAYATWEAGGRRTMGERLRARVKDILAKHKVEPLDEALTRELDRIAEAAKRELGG
jgi:trimethylamine--corrinoid protein Co-methyltransferase